MTDEKDQSEEEASAAEPSRPQGGARLAKARRALQISVAEVAKELHLDEPKVHALERNDFDVLGAPVFAKGHLRKYAKLVRVDEKDVMSDYYDLTRAAGVPPLVTTHRRARREMTPGPWIAVIVVLIVVASAYWWLTSRSPVIDAPAPAAIPEATSQETPPAATGTEEAVDDSPAEDAGDAGEIPPDATTDSADAATAEPDDSAVLAAGGEAEPLDTAERQAPQLQDGQVRLLLTYRGDCWTEITDARGRRLFFDLGKDGRTVELSGEAPFNVLFGNADNVAIRINGVDRAISAGERRGRTARLTIAGT